MTERFQIRWATLADVKPLAELWIHLDESINNNNLLALFKVEEIRSRARNELHGLVTEPGKILLVAEKNPKEKDAASQLLGACVIQIRYGPSEKVGWSGKAICEISLVATQKGRAGRKVSQRLIRQAAHLASVEGAQKVFVQDAPFQTPHRFAFWPWGV